MHRGSCGNYYLNNREYNYCPHYKFIERTCDNRCEKKTPIENHTCIQYSPCMLSDYRLFHGSDWTAYFHCPQHSNLQVDGSNAYCFIRKLSNAVITVLGRASLLHLTLTFLDRYIAIKHPYRYTNVVTQTRILCSSAFVWIVVLLSTATSFTSNNSLGQLYNGSTIIAVCCAGIIIFCQVVLYYEARRQEKQIAAHHVSEDNRQKFVKEKKALKLTTTVLFFLVLSYSPLIVVNILIRISFIESSCAAHIALAIACFLIILNSLINPTIYCIRRRQFRVAFIEILLRKSNVEAQETEMRMNRARELRLRWRSQNNEQKNSLSTANNTVKCGVNNIGCHKDQYSNFNSIT